MRQRASSLRIIPSKTMTRTTHKKVGIVMVPKIRSEEVPKAGKTHFTDREICDIVEVGTILRRVHSRLLREGKLQHKDLQTT